MITGSILFVMLIYALTTPTKELSTLNQKELYNIRKTEMEKNKMEIKPTSIPISEAIDKRELNNDGTEPQEDETVCLKKHQRLLNNLRKKSPKYSIVELSKKLKIEYWTSDKDNNKNTRGYIIDFEKIENINNVWKTEKPLKVVTHGWLSGPEEKKMFSIKKAYATHKPNKYNIITLDWTQLSVSEKWYTAARNCKKLGILLSHFLIKLITLEIIHPSQIHMIGHGLGAHLLGACGMKFYEFTNMKIGRITGLDPLGPSIKYSSFYWIRRLNKKDALFVDVIHTTVAEEAINFKTIGHADFYPDGGKSPQRGCEEEINALLCSHSISYKYYYTSILNDSNYYKCTRFDKLLPYGEEFDKQTIYNNKNYMGHYAHKRWEGMFNIDLSSKPIINLDNEE